MDIEYEGKKYTFKDVVKTMDVIGGKQLAIRHILGDLLGDAAKQRLNEALASGELSAAIEMFGILQLSVDPKITFEQINDNVDMYTYFLIQLRGGKKK